MGAPRTPEGRFQNLDPTTTPRFSKVFKWSVVDKVLGRRRKTPSSAPVDALETVDVREAPCAIWLGHATALVRLGGAWILTDPLFTPKLTPITPRNVPVVLEPEALPRIDAIVLSHNHRDHLDKRSLLAVERRDRPRYCVPLGLDRYLVAWGVDPARITALDWWSEPTPIDENRAVVAHCVPAQHWSQRNATDRNKSLWAGFVLDDGAHRVYFVGDSGYCDTFAEVGRRFPGLDLALVPIGAYEPRWFMSPQHMDPVEALATFHELGAERMLSIHWGTYKLTDERLDEPPLVLAEAIRERGSDAQAIHTLPVGGRVELA